MQLTEIAAPLAGAGASQTIAGEALGVSSPHAFPAGVRDAAPEPRASASTYAALDLGTNNCRLLVARPDRERGFRVVDSFSRIVRLGEGLAHTGRLSDDAIRRAVQALGVCRDKMNARGVSRARLIATEACRQAVNGGDFLDRVREETGLALEIIDRATEARLAAAGCASLADPAAGGVILFDIGGGSSEVVWLERKRGGGVGPFAMRAWASLPVGVVTLAERYGGVKVTTDVFERMVCEVDAMLEAFPERETLSASLGDIHFLGTSGTVTTIAGVHLGLPRYERRLVDGQWLAAHDVTRVVESLREMSYDQRCQNPCIGPDRADLVLAGCAVLEAIRRAFPVARLRVADRGLREGILVELMRADGVWRRRGPRRRGRRGVSREKGGGAGRELGVRVHTARKRSHASTLWLNRQLNDPYVQAAKREGFRSRAAYKLLEIDEKRKLLRPGQRVVDLGAAPGGWSQVAAEKVGAKDGRGKVVAIDLLEMEPIPGVDFMQLDFLDEQAPEILKQRLGGPADLVLSDMAANTTGHRKTDHLRIVALVEAAAMFAAEVLAPGGAFLAKVVQGGTEGALLAGLKRDYAKVAHIKPPASRKDSAELYVLATGFHGVRERQEDA